MDIVKGNQYSIKVKFYKNGTPAVFNNPPKWTLYNSSDIEILSGAASAISTFWQSTFTIPSNYLVPNGKENMILQFTGYDVKNNAYTTDKDIVLIDKSETFIPNGVIYNYISDENITDSITLPDDEADIEIRLFDPFGTQVGAAIINDAVAYSSKNSNGYIYDIEIPKLAIPKNIYLDAFTILYKTTSASGSNTETHPLYILDFKTISIVNSLITMLDKSKLIEVDPSLAWHDVELIQAVQEGVKRINSSPPEGTFWKLHDFPTTLDLYLIYASAVQALNSRVLAEGLNAFDFTGLNTNLNYNRTDALNQMIDRLNAFLDTLPQAKKSAINIAGKGEVGPNETDNRIKNLGKLAVSVNPLNNRVGYDRFRRFY